MRWCVGTGICHALSAGHGQGNFGNIDGDNVAAEGYTEARMTNVAQLLLDGIDEDIMISGLHMMASLKNQLLPAGSNLP